MDLEYVGWQVGITYMSGRPAGLDRTYLMALLDEMVTHGMNLLSLMMISYGYFDPTHDGYAWPVQNPKLECYRDSDAVNANPDSEFLGDVIDEAGDRGITVEFFLNWGIWNPERIQASYPNAHIQVNSGGDPAGWLHCPDSPGGWQLGFDEIADLLEVYPSKSIKRFAFERVGYAGKAFCHCPYTVDVFQEQTGKNLSETSKGDLLAWKQDHVSDLLRKYITHAKELKPGIKVGLHTQGNRWWGHDPAKFPDLGVDFLEPHTIQFKSDRRKKTIYKRLRNLAPNPCTIHFCARDQAPANYNLWIKTPKIIQRVLRWIRDYPGDNIEGILFFNEPAVSPANKLGVYGGLEQFKIEK